jgi:hypothetical protein
MSKLNSVELVPEREYRLFALMWFRPDLIGLFSNNLVAFSRNVIPDRPSFSVNLVSKQRMFLGQAIYVLGSLQL